jgi:hypothetical protein
VSNLTIETKENATTTITSGYFSTNINPGEGYKLVEYAEGIYKVVEDIPTATTWDELIEYANNGKNSVILNADITAGYAVIKNDLSIDLNNHTLDLSKGIKLTSSFKMTNGTCAFNDSKYIEVRFTQPDGENIDDTRTLTFSDVKFINNYRAKTSKNSGTERVKEMLKITADYVGKTNVDIQFNKCTFNNTKVYFAGQSSGKDQYLNATFNECTFNALTKSEEVIQIGNYINSEEARGNVTIQKCTFNFELTKSDHYSVIDLSNSSSTRVDVKLNSNILNAKVATESTDDSDEKNHVKLDYYKPTGFAFFHSGYLSGGYSTITGDGNNKLNNVGESLTKGVRYDWNKKQEDGKPWVK